MYEEHIIGVVIPAYNESGFVGDVIETLPPFVDRVYAIDDCSTDDTWPEMKAAAGRVNDSIEDRDAAFSERVVCIQHESNAGVGGAIKTGYLRAREDGIDVTAVMAGDGQMDPGRLERIIKPVVRGEADYAKGNRFIKTEHHAEMPKHRYVGNLLLTYLTKIATGYWDVSDPQMGYTAISHEALSGTDIENMYEFYGYCNDLLVRLSAAGYRVADVPAPVTYDEETSHISYRSYIPLVSFMLLRTFLWRILVRRHSPVETIRTGLYLGGAAGVFVGIVSMLRSKRSIRLPIAGVVLLVGGMISDAIVNRPKNDRIE